MFAKSYILLCIIWYIPLFHLSSCLQKIELGEVKHHSLHVIHWLRVEIFSQCVEESLRKNKVRFASPELVMFHCCIFCEHIAKIFEVSVIPTKICVHNILCQTFFCFLISHWRNLRLWNRFLSLGFIVGIIGILCCWCGRSWGTYNIAAFYLNNMYAWFLIILFHTDIIKIFISWI